MFGQSRLDGYLGMILAYEEGKWWRGDDAAVIKIVRISNPFGVSLISTQGQALHTC
jgi:hypothetical protein